MLPSMYIIVVAISVRVGMCTVSTTPDIGTDPSEVNSSCNLVSEDCFAVRARCTVQPYSVELV